MQVKHFVGIFIISVGLGQALALPSNHSSLLIKRRACASEEIQNRDPGVNPISCTFDCGIEGPCCTLAGNDVCYGKSDFQPCNNNDMECTNKWCADGTCLDPDPAVTRGRWVGQACKVGDNCASGTCDTGVCVDNAQCGSKASCATGEICHENECLEGALTVGRNCKTDLQCDNLSCWKEICRIPSDVDDPCTENNSCLDGLTCNLDTLKCIEGGGPVPADIGGDCEANEGCHSGYCNLSNLKCEERPDTKTENGRDCSSNDECNSNFCSPEGKCADQTVEPVDPPNPNPDTDTGTEPGNGGDPEDPDTGGDSSQPIIVQPVVIIQTETRNGAPVTVTRTTSPGSTRAAVSGSSRASVTARVAASGGDRRWEIPLASELMGLAVAAIGLAMGAVGVVLI